MAGFNKSSSILIVGGGAWGTSTALALSRVGYTSITVLDPFSVPSPLSAATDINKIVDGAYTAGGVTPVGRALALSVERWAEDPVYAPFHHPTGIVLAGSTPKVIQMLHEDDLPYVPNAIKYDSPGDFRKALGPGYTGTFPKWKGFIDNNPGAGWVDSAKAVRAAAEEASRQGVTFRQAKVVGLSYAREGSDVIGVTCEGGLEITADRTILCAGAYTSQIFDLQDEVHATAWVIAHIKLSSEELAALKGSPVLWSNNMGFIMPPEDGDELKVCDQHPGYVNRQMLRGRLQSVPFYRDDMPLAAEHRVRQLLRETLPHLADRSFSHARICWDTDTSDGTFLIDSPQKHPSLVIAVGGSGLGVMHMPMVGEWVMAKLEGRLDPDLAHIWRLRPELSRDRDWRDIPHAWADPSDKREDIRDEQGWTNVGMPFVPS